MVGGQQEHLVAQEWAASAIIDAEPDITLAAVFAIAISPFAPSAISTVRVLSPDSATGAIGWTSCSEVTVPEFPARGDSISDYVWQVGHQNTLRPSSTAVSTLVRQMRQGSPARR